MKKTIPRISEAEWTIMKILWKESPQSAQDVIDRLGDASQWHPKTVKTLFGRLVKKGALHFSKEGRTYFYSPRVSEAECIREESRSFVQRFFGGGLQPMLAHFVEEGQLTSKQLDELKAILKSKDKPL